MRSIPARFRYSLSGGGIRSRRETTVSSVPSPPATGWRGGFRSCVDRLCRTASSSHCASESSFRLPGSTRDRRRYRPSIGRVYTVVDGHVTLFAFRVFDVLTVLTGCHVPRTRSDATPNRRQRVRSTDDELLHPMPPPKRPIPGRTRGTTAPHVLSRRDHAAPSPRPMNDTRLDVRPRLSTHRGQDRPSVIVELQS